MRNLLQELQLRLDKVNARRAATDPLDAKANLTVRSERADEHFRLIHCADIESIGADYIEVSAASMSPTMFCRSEILSVQPVNF